MPDTRKHILVEPETHAEFMDFADANNKTQDLGLRYLLRFKKLVEKQNKELTKKIKFTLN